MLVQPINQKSLRTSKRAASSDFSRSIKKRTFNPLMETTISKKQMSKAKEPIIPGPLDLLSLYFREPSKLKEQLEKSLAALSIKVVATSASFIYKCEKSGIKFDLHINTAIEAGIIIQAKRRQGNNNSFRDTVNSILKRLNEMIDA